MLLIEKLENIEKHENKLQPQHSNIISVNILLYCLSTFIQCFFKIGIASLMFLVFVFVCFFYLGLSIFILFIFLLFLGIA